MSGKRCYIHRLPGGLQRVRIEWNSREPLAIRIAQEVHGRRRMICELNGCQGNPAIAGEHSGCSLAEFRYHCRFIKHCPVIMRMSIDKPGCASQFAEFNHASCLAIHRWPDASRASTINGDLTGKCRPSLAADDGHGSHQQIEVLRTHFKFMMPASYAGCCRAG